MTELDDYRAGPYRCPNCKAPNDGHLATPGNNPGPPKVGDLSICAYCATLAFYAEEGQLRLPSSDEAAQLHLEPDVRRARAAVLQVIQSTKPGLS